MKKKPPIKRQLTPKASVVLKKRSEAARKQEQRQRQREIDIPECVDPARRESCRLDLERFCLTYKSASFPLPFSEDHKRVISTMQEAVLTGGLFVLACWRSFGKTTISETCAEWAALYGHKGYVLIIGATLDAAVEIIGSIITDFEENQTIIDDFPEVGVCIRELEGRPQKAQSQSYLGKLTNVEARKSLIVFPTLTFPAGDPRQSANGQIIKGLGLTGRLRGLNHKMRDGTVKRPDFAIPDDPQTDESATSIGQCDQREKLIVRAVGGSSGPGSVMSCVIPCTVIAKGDLSDRFLDPKLHPEFKRAKCVLVKKWPDSQKTLWREYAEIRHKDESDGGGVQAATEFYGAHRKEMDAGAVVAWEQWFDEPAELSAVQHIENMLLRYGEDGFAAEFQGEPKDNAMRPYQITPEVVQTKINHLARGVAPDNAGHITCMADVNKFAVVWCVTAWSNDFTGYIIDYGRWPDKGTLYKDGHGETEEQAVFRGVTGFLTDLYAREYRRGNQPAQVDVTQVDCGWHQDTVLRSVAMFQRQSRRVIASKGFGQRYRVRRPIGKPGTECHLTELPSRDRCVEFNSGFWVVRVQQAFMLPAGAPGSLTLWGDDKTAHRKFSREVCGQKLLSAHQGEQGMLYEWDYAVGERHDDLDAVVGCAVGASLCGLSLHIAQPSQQADQQKSGISVTKVERKRTFVTYES